MNIIEWMLSEKIAENGFAASHIANGLKLAEVDRAEQEARCKRYRLWRNKTEKKESKRIPSWQAYQLAIYGLEPNDVEPRQIEMSIQDE